MQNVGYAEYEGDRHVLEAPLIAHRTAPYVRPDDFDWEGLLAEAESMSGGERLLVHVAYELWHAEKTIGLWELPRRLDVPSFRRVLEALCLCRGSTGAVFAQLLRSVPTHELAA
jgi:hypothetical protein